MQAIISIANGGLLGISSAGGMGALLGAAIGWLVWQAVQQQRAITALQKSVRDLTAALAFALPSSKIFLPAAILPVNLSTPCGSG